MSACAQRVVKKATALRDVVGRARPKQRSRGLSLIEVMVALAIAILLLLGLTQIFVGSKNVYRLEEGMSRVQENARYVLQYLEDNVRMAGYMGCGNDLDLTTRSGSPPAFLNHLEQLSSGLGVIPVQQNLAQSEDFQRPIEAFAYNGSIDGVEPTRGVATDWTPALPIDLELPIGDMPAKGSDVLVLRIFSGESTAMMGDFNMAGSFNVADPTFVKPGQIYALTNCANARIFKASGTGANPILATAGDNQLRMTADTSSTWTGTYANMQFNQSGTMLNAEVHKAEYLVIYVGIRDDDDGSAVPVLKVASGPKNGVVPVDIAENVEAMRVSFGIDDDGNGTVDRFAGADDPSLVGMAPNLRDTNWRKVLSVRVALLMRSQEHANASAHTGDAPDDNVYHLFDASIQRPVDARFRDVYTTTIALRNRLNNY